MLDILYFLPNNSKATELWWVFKGPGPEVRKPKICIFSLLPVTMEFGGKLLNLVSEISSVKCGNLMPTSLRVLVKTKQEKSLRGLLGAWPTAGTR